MAIYLFNVKTFVLFFLSLIPLIDKGGVGLLYIYRMVFTYYTQTSVALYNLRTDPIEAVSVAEVRLPSDCIATVPAQTYRKQVMWFLASDFIGALSFA
jgi:hypothetical protein